MGAPAQGKVALIAIVLATCSLGLLMAPAVQAAPIIVSHSGAASVGEVPTLVVPAPAGTAAGQVLVAQVVVKGASVVQAPAGWSAMVPDVDNTAGNPVRMTVFRKTATDSEPAAYTFGAAPATRIAVGIMAVSGLDPSFASARVTSAVDSDSPAIAPGVNARSADTLVLFFAGVERGTTCNAMAAGQTLQYGAISTGGGGGSNQDATACAGYLVAAGAGPTPDGEFFLSKRDSSVLLTIGVSVPTVAWAPSALGAQIAEDAQFSAEVALSAATSEPVQVPFTAASGSGSLGAACAPGIDARLATSSPLDIAPNTLVGRILIVTCPDARGEAEETFTITLGTPTQAELTGPSTITVTVLDDDPPFVVAPHPLLADGAEDVGRRWGGWDAFPGQEGPVWASNFLSIRNNGPHPDLAITIDFGDDFVAASGDVVPIGGNIRFACRETTAGTAPGPVTSFTLQEVATYGSVTAAFTAVDNVLHCTYALHQVPDLLGAGDYQAAFVVV